MRKIIYILLLTPFLTFGQNNQKNINGTYSFSESGFYYKLDLNNDSTFKYEQSFNLGSTSSKGNWERSNDTLILSDYEIPWTISHVEEKTIDSLKNRVLIEIKVNDTNSIKIRGDHVVYIDGNPTSVIYDYLKEIYKVRDFDVWINDNCRMKRQTNNKGFVEFTVDSIGKISINYNEYLIRNKECNYFLVSLANTPIIFSPPILKWTRWKIKKQILIPLECNELLDNIELKR